MPNPTAIKPSDASATKAIVSLTAMARGSGMEPPPSWPRGAGETGTATSTKVSPAPTVPRRPTTTRPESTTATALASPGKVSEERSAGAAGSVMSTIWSPWLPAAR